MVNVNEKIELIKRQLKLKDPNAEYEVAITDYKKLYQIKVWQKSSNYFGITRNLIIEKNLSEDELLNLDEKAIEKFTQNICQDRPKPGPEMK